jgi:hypothetical protein
MTHMQKIFAHPVRGLALTLAFVLPLALLGCSKDESAQHRRPLRPPSCVPAGAAARAAAAQVRLRADRSRQRPRLAALDPTRVRSRQA